MRKTNSHPLVADRFRWVRRTLRALTLTAVLLTLTPSIAGARPPGPDPQPFTNPGPAPTIVHVTTPSGFDWGDAGIGAAAGLAIALVAVGCTLAASRRRHHGPPGPAAPIG